MTSEPKAPELLPCPFCGETPETSHGGKYAFHDTCGAFRGVLVDSQVWNRRADAAQAMVAAAYEDAAQQCYADQGRFDSPDRIRGLTPEDAKEALAERDNATWNAALDAAFSALAKRRDHYKAKQARNDPLEDGDLNRHEQIEHTIEAHDYGLAAIEALKKGPQE